METKEAEELIPKFEVGDRVLVTRVSEPGDHGHIGFFDDQKDCVGKSFVIADTWSQAKFVLGFFYRLEGGSPWYYPECVLQKMSKWKLKQLEESKSDK